MYAISAPKWWCDWYDPWLVEVLYFTRFYPPLYVLFLLYIGCGTDKSLSLHFSMLGLFPNLLLQQGVIDDS